MVLVSIDLLYGVGWEVWGIRTVEVRTEWRCEINDVMVLTA